MYLFIFTRQSDRHTSIYFTCIIKLWNKSIMFLWIKFLHQICYKYFNKIRSIGFRPPSQRGHSVTVFRQSFPFLDKSTKLFWLAQQDETLQMWHTEIPHTEELVFTINREKHSTCSLWKVAFIIINFLWFPFSFNDHLNTHHALSCDRRTLCAF